MNSGAEVQTAAAATASAMFLMCSTFLVEYCSLVTRKLAIWFQSSSGLSKEIRTDVTAARHLLGTLGRLTGANLNGCHRGSAANSDRFERRLKRGRGLADAQGHRCDRASLLASVAFVRGLIFEQRQSSRNADGTFRDKGAAWTRNITWLAPIDRSNRNVWDQKGWGWRNEPPILKHAHLFLRCLIDASNLTNSLNVKHNHHDVALLRRLSAVGSEIFIPSQGTYRSDCLRSWLK
jgi:hypothetical protein